MEKSTRQHLFKKLLSGKATSEEIEKINHWFDSYETEEKVIIADFKNRSKNEIKEKLFDQIKNKSGLNTYQRKIRNNHIFRFAAAACLIVGFLFYGLKISSQKESNINEETFISFENAVGMIKRIKLPDGSQVQLFHNSSIEVHKNFSESRHIVLHGKAFFDVQPNPELPFTIQSNTFKTTVLGTSFSIESRADQKERVAVKSGIVTVESKEHGEVKLTELESIELNDDQLKQEAIGDADLEFGWTEKIIAFNNTEIKSMIAQIEDWYGVEISCNCDTYPKRKISGLYKDMTLEELLITIQFSIPLKFEIHDQKVRLKFQECQ